MNLRIQSNGSEIESTNYFETDLARRGGMYLSINAGAFRLLLPAGAESMLADMQTATDVVVSRGKFNKFNGQDALEILFDDYSDSPFSIHLGQNQIDRLPPVQDTERKWTLSVWVKGPRCVYRAVCFFRVVPTLPYLKPVGE